MSVQLQLTPGAVAVGVGVLVGGFLLWRASKVAGEVAGAAVETAKDAAWAVTPWNQENVFYGLANDAGGAIVTDPAGPGKNADGSWTLGGWFYDITHPATAPTGSSLTAAEADAARDRYALTDPRRVDLAAFGIYPNP